VSCARALFAAALLAAAAGCASAGGAETRGASSGETARTSPAVSDGARIHVTIQDGAAIAVIDVTRRAVVDRVDLQSLGFGPTAKPHDIAAEPDGSFWYVTLIGEGRVLKFDRENRVVGQAEMEVPGLAVAHPTQDLLLVGRSMTAVNPPSSVAFIRRSDMTLLDELEVIFPRPHALAVRPAGDRAYSASLADDRLAVIDPAEGGVALIDLPADSLVPLGRIDHEGRDHGAHAPHTVVEFAIAPDGRTMVASGELSGVLLVFDLTDPDMPRVVRTVELGGSPWHPAFTPDGRWVWVPLHRDNAVAVIDAATWEVVARVEGRGLAQPHAIVIPPDGRFVFVSNNNTGGEYVPAGADPKSGTVVVIDAATRAIVEVLEVGPNATGMDLVPESSE
jgi:DNA-binding beta-propeller fold protein YncE